MTITLRPYQIDARDSALALMEQEPHPRASLLHAAGATRQAALLAMATGSGKTETVFGVFDALLARDAALRILCIAHTDELVLQPVERILRDWPTLPVPGVVKAGQNDVGAQIISSSIQTLSSPGRMDALLAAGALDVCFYDECHRSAARTPKAALAALYTANSAMRLIGASATPTRSDGLGIGRIFGPEPAYKVSIKDAIYTLRCITEFEAYAAHLDRDEHDFSDVRTNAVGDYAQGETGRILSLASALEIIIEKWKEVAHDRPTIAFTASVQQAHDLAAAFRDTGIKADAIDGTTPREERRAIIQKFHNGAIQVLCGCAIFIEGFDAPRASCALICRPTQHDGAYIQMTGRVLRWFDKKAGLADDAGHPNAVIIDVVPKGARDLVMAGSIMGKPITLKKAEDRAREQGLTHPLFPLPAFDGGIDASPDDVYLAALDLFGNSRLAWFTDGMVHTLSIGTDADGRSLSLMIVQNGGFEVWRLMQPKWVNRVRLDGGARRIGKYKDFESANDAAAEIAGTQGQSILNERSKRWRSGEPSAGQIKMLRNLHVLKGGEMPPLTKGEAATLINHEQCRRALDTLRRKGAIKNERE
jgi:superfamily II DNA or RNA helicase